MALRTLNFGEYLHGTLEERFNFGITLVQSFKESGFVKLTNHGISEEIIEEYLEMTVQYFKLPRATKEEMANTRGPFPQRGWSCVGAEKTAKVRKENLKDSNGEDMEDSKEHVDIGPFDDTEYPNRWPKEEDLPGFRRLIKKCYDRLQRTSLEIIGAIELGLELPPGVFANRCKPDASEIRILHYPPVSLKTLNEGNIRRAWPHTDFGIITLLFQDSVGGLELQDRRDPSSFVPVLPAPPGGPSEMVVNISDMLQRWTNNAIKAGVHQVSVPRSFKSRGADGVNGLTEEVIPVRHSAIFFFKPHRKTSAGPLSEFVREDMPAAYDEITALEYQKRMTQVLYSAAP